jgi:hypothetical protein
MNKISTETINKLIEAKKNNVEHVKIGIVDGEEIILEVKKALTMEEIYSVCSALSTSPFVKSDDVTMYVPSAEITSFKVALIKAFVTNIELPEDVLKAYQVCSNLNLFSKLSYALKNNSTYRDLLTIADRYSEYHRLSNSGIANIIPFITKALSEVDIQDLITKFMTEYADLQMSNENDEIMNSSEDVTGNEDE